MRRFHRVSRRRAYACDHCGAQIYPTAGTFMEGSGLNVATWFSAVSRGAGGHGRTRHREHWPASYDVSYKTALRMKRRIAGARHTGGTDARLLEKLHRQDMGHEAGDVGGVPRDGVPRERASQARDHIRAAACRAFAARGPAATRIADIAREAGVSSAIIHYYYRSKDEVLLAALQWANEHTSRWLQELRDDRDRPSRAAAPHARAGGALRGCATR